MTEAEYSEGDVVYFKNTNLKSVITKAIYYTPEMVQHRTGVQAATGWRYEIDGAPGLHYFEWQFSHSPTWRNPVVDNGWQALRDKYRMEGDK